MFSDPAKKAWMPGSSPGMTTFGLLASDSKASHPEIAPPDAVIAAQRRRIPLPDDAALLDDVMAVGEAGQRGEVLVDDQDGEAERLEAREAAPDLGAHQRRQTLGRFVEDKKARIGHQGAADRQHLLLAAGEKTARGRFALRESGEEIEDGLVGPSLAAGAI